MSDELFEAIEQHDLKKLNALLALGVSPNDPLEEYPFWLPLEASIEELEFGGKLEIVRNLIRFGADVNAWDRNHSLTPIHCAVFHSNVEAVRLLLDNGADPNCITDEGDTPLKWAALTKHIELAELLMPKCTLDNINYFGGFNGDSALTIAVTNLDIPMIDLLISSGADPDSLSADRETARDFLPPPDDNNVELLKAAEALLNNQPA